MSTQSPDHGERRATRGTGNLALAVGNPGNNNGFVVQGIVNLAPRANQPAFAEAAGTFNRAIVVGNGSRALANGGPRTGAITPIGDNTAITLGNGSNSYAGAIPAQIGTNSPRNQFAVALGNNQKAVNGINNG
jgi:hypothetical protein